MLPATFIESDYSEHEDHAGRQQGRAGAPDRDHGRGQVDDPSGGADLRQGHAGGVEHEHCPEERDQLATLLAHLAEAIPSVAATQLLVTGRQR